MTDLAFPCVLFEGETMVPDFANSKELRMRLVSFRLVALSESRAVNQNLVDGQWEPKLNEFPVNEEIKIVSMERKVL